jgi:hypothetical protein
MAKVFSPYKVSVVVDREFGEQLARLTPGAPVWIVDTPINKPVAQRLWREQPQNDSLTGITTFDFSNSASPEDIVASMLGAIDLHHGHYSADPPYTVIEVFGARLTDKLKAELSEYGFSEFEPGSTGFRAIRPLPAD